MAVSRGTVPQITAAEGPGGWAGLLPNGQNPFLWASDGMSYTGILANPPKSGRGRGKRKFSTKLEVNSKLLQICQKQDQEGKAFFMLTPPPPNS